ncbi:MAG TPA: sigma-70 family RNA polymerase sigma factor [Candidatus Limnocylindria bacterium]|nr:sigma-70 family RNA polymerase sigma factor [Candidatus Limnocylindria bacterium]
MKTQRDPAAGDTRTDHDLVYAARDGDTIAFDALFYRYRDGIFRLGLAITKDPSAAEEIVVDTFARAHRALARLEPDDSLRPWLYRVAVNLSYNRRPRKGLILSSLDEAVDELGPKHRLVVVLHYMNGLNLTEIAEVVDCPVGTVKSRLHYALRRLRTHLAAHPELGIEPSRPIMATELRVPKQITAAVPIEGE